MEKERKNLTCNFAYFAIYHDPILAEFFHILKDETDGVKDVRVIAALHSASGEDIFRRLGFFTIGLLWDEPVGHHR